MKLPSKFRPNSLAVLIIVIIFIFAFITLDIATAVRFPKSTSFRSHISAIAFAQKNLPLKVIIIPTTIPTPTPTPTPIYYGYCLNVPVLYYHHIASSDIARARGFSSLNVDAGIFDEQMAYLSSHGFTSIFGEDLVNALKNHTALSPKSVVVTLDDAYDDQYSNAFQIAKKYGIKLTLFVPTGLLGGVSATNSYFTWGQLSEMVNSGLVEVENHTWSHYSMGTKGADKDMYELKTAEDQLQQNLGKHSLVFAYPYGTNELSGFVWGELAQFGFLGAFSTIGGTYQCDSFLYALHRTRIGSVPFPAFGIY